MEKECLRKDFAASDVCLHDAAAGEWQAGGGGAGRDYLCCCRGSRYVTYVGVSHFEVCFGSDS